MLLRILDKFAQGILCITKEKLYHYADMLKNHLEYKAYSSFERKLIF